MALSYRYAVDDKKVRRWFEEASKAGRSLRVPMGRIGLFVARNAKRRLRARRKRKFPMSGMLAKSIHHVLDGESAVLVGSNLPYAKIQQLGGIITPKRVKALTIPMQPYLARSRMWPRDFPKGVLVFVAAKPGARRDTIGYLFRAKKTEQTIQHGKRAGQKRQVGKVGELMYVLVKVVAVVGDPYLLFGAEEKAFADKTLNNHYLGRLKTGKK